MSGKKNFGHTLKACPFCGSSDVTLERAGIAGFYSVTCEACGAFVFGSPIRSTLKARETAVEKWNKRA
jgi:Lar family restriction alleviation protein